MSDINTTPVDLANLGTTSNNSGLPNGSSQSRS